MNKEKFDYCWKIVLIMILLFSLAIMFKQFSQINKEGLACKKQPFVWGASEFSKEYNNDPVFCSCTIGSRTFTFNENVFNPKIRGTQVLDRIFKNVDLDFLVLCSSIGAILGSMGDTIYCAANAFIDAFAHYKSFEDGCYIAAINWNACKKWGEPLKWSND